MRHLLILTTALLLFVSCEEDDDGNFITDFLQCEDETATTPDRLSTEIVGEWDFFMIRCPMSNYVETIDQDIYIEFLSDGTMNRFTNGTLESTHTWQPEIVDDQVINILIEPGFSEVRGGFFFCNDRMAFQNSYIDGCDYFYRKD